jgi:hypothetical protein
MLFVFLLLSLMLSCYGPELDDIDKNIAELKSSVDDLKKKIEGKRFITSITTIAGGFRIIFDDNSVFDIVNGKDGAKGDPGTSWKIMPVDAINNPDVLVWWYTDTEGKWQATTHLAVPGKGSQGDPGQPGPAGDSAPSPKISPDGFWVLHEWNPVDSSYMEVRTNIPASTLPYVLDRSTYKLLFIPKVDTVNFNPPKIVYDSIPLPINAASSLSITFMGYGYLDANTGDIRQLDSLAFNFWTVNSVQVNSLWQALGGLKQITDVTATGDSIPNRDLKDKLVVVYRSSSALTGPLHLQDSRPQDHELFELDPGIYKTTGVLTKAAYRDTVYYSFMQIRRGFDPLLVRQGRPFFYLLSDTTRSSEGYTIRSTYGPHGLIAPMVQTLGKGPAEPTTDSRPHYFYFKIDTGTSLSPIYSRPILVNSEYLYDYLIKDTATASTSKIILSADKKTFRLNSGIDTPSYIISLQKLLYNGTIEADTLIISTRDTVRDLIKYPVP